MSEALLRAVAAMVMAERRLPVKDGRGVEVRRETDGEWAARLVALGREAMGHKAPRRD